ncbi:MAG: sensor histidine kinase [Promethearchaeota archaeon]
MSGELKEQSIIGSVAWRVLLAILVVSGLFLLYNPLWALSSVRVGLHTLLAFLAFIGAATVSFDIRKKSLAWKYFLLAVFLFVAIVNFVAALWHLSPAYYSDEIVEVAADLVETLIMVVLLLGVVVPSKWAKSEINYKHGIELLSLLTVTSLLCYSLIYYLLLPSLLPFDTISIGIGLAIINVVINALLFVLIFQTADALQRFDKVTFISALFLIGISSLLLLLSFLQPMNLLSASAMIRAALMYSLFIAVALPVQSQLGINRRRAYLHTSVLAILTIIPYLLTVLIVSIIPFYWLFPEQAIYSLTHLIVAVLAAIIVRLLWRFTKQQPHWHRYPMILAILSITIVESTIFFISPWVEITGEYTLLFVISGTMMVVCLTQTLWWIFHPPTKYQHSQMIWWLAGISFIMLLVILGGVWLQSSLQVLFFWVNLQILFRSILLGVCFVSIFLLTYLFIIFLQVSKGRLTMGIIVLGTLTLWVISNMIRVNFVDWSAGWWIAQFLLLFGFMLGPATLGRMYLSSYEHSETERKRATLYADILIHDLRNYHTVIQSSIDLLTLAQDPTEVVDDVTDQIQIALDRAQRLITNVRSIELAKALQPKDLTRIDIVHMIQEAWNHVLSTNEEEVEFQVDRKVNECFVEANELLLEVFINLLLNSLQYSIEVKRIHVTIAAIEQDKMRFWEIRVIDWGKGIPPEDKLNLFSRYSEGAKGLGLGLSVAKSLVDAFQGTITVENRIPDDYTQGTVFVITFPSA